MEIIISLVRIHIEPNKVTMGLAYTAKKYEVPCRRYHTAKFCPQIQ